ncbi:MAG: hypothetical protein CHH17_16570 [Candidatus Fluviicola riflensis]|nr:MAG: hypothetical protein CHH17_16570 [Candidatus Fluviicola riflensis]
MNSESLIDVVSVAALQTGSPEAFGLLVDQYSDKIYRLVFGIVQRQEEAEDITQEVFTTVFTSVARFKGDSLISTWMYRIAVNKCQEFLRKQSRGKRSGKHVTYEQVQGTSQQMSSTYMHPGNELENQERGIILLNAMNQLTEQQRIAFTMNKQEGFSYEEIAQAMNLSKSSIESLIFRAKKHLQVLLAAYYDEHINR